MLRYSPPLDPALRIRKLMDMQDPRSTSQIGHLVWHERNYTETIIREGGRALRRIFQHDLHFSSTRPRIDNPAPHGGVCLPQAGDHIVQVLLDLIQEAENLTVKRF